jgi:STE24 endopeptidase
MTILGMITGLLFKLYSTFRIKRRHGFNKTTIGLFVTNMVKGLILTTFLGGLFMALLLKMIKWGAKRFYLFVWGFTFVFSLFMMTFYPMVIMPIFNTYKALPPGKLKDCMYALTDKLHFMLTKIFVINGSKRSSHYNAFMVGFFKNKRIILFGMLLKQVHDNEVLAILGHKLGHWKMGHTIMNFVISQLYTDAATYAFLLCYNFHKLYQAFGIGDDSRTVPMIIALLLFFGTMWEPINKVISNAMTKHSRKCEFAYKPTSRPTSGDFIINRKNRCGTSELDAHKSCSTVCKKDSQCLTLSDKTALLWRFCKLVLLHTQADI